MKPFFEIFLAKGFISNVLRMRISRKQKVLCTPGIRGVVAATMGPGSSDDLGPIHRRTSFFQSVEHYLGCRTCISCKTHAGRFIYWPLFCVKGILDKNTIRAGSLPTKLEQKQSWNKWEVLFALWKNSLRPRLHCTVFIRKWYGNVVLWKRHSVNTQVFLMQQSSFDAG